MTAADRATFQAWDESGLTEVMRPTLAGMLARAGRTDRLFAFARDVDFLAEQVDDLRHAEADRDDRGPLATLDLALRHAIKEGRPAEMAEFLLARARWERRLGRDPVLAARTFLSSSDAGFDLGFDDAGSPPPLRDRFVAQRAVLWQLLLAWEQYDSGNPGEARKTLQRLSLSFNPSAC